MSRAARWLGIERNELRRPSDRVESAAKAFALSAALLAVPFSLAMGSSAYYQATIEAATQLQSAASVQATVLEEPRQTTISTGRATVVAVPMLGEVAWTTPSGARRTATVPLRAGAAVGSTVAVWLDADGDPTTAPQSSLEQLTSGFFVGILVFGGILSGIIVLLVVVRILLDRQRSAQWAAEWQRVGPEWSRPWRPR